LPDNSGLREYLRTVLLQPSSACRSAVRSSTRTAADCGRARTSARVLSFNSCCQRTRTVHRDWPPPFLFVAWVPGTDNRLHFCESYRFGKRSNRQILILTRRRAFASLSNDPRRQNLVSAFGVSGRGSFGFSSTSQARSAVRGSSREARATVPASPPVAR
jgi:hypothetical protein